MPVCLREATLSVTSSHHKSLPSRSFQEKSEDERVTYTHVLVFTSIQGSSADMCAGLRQHSMVDIFGPFHSSHMGCQRKLGSLSAESIVVMMSAHAKTLHERPCHHARKYSASKMPQSLRPTMREACIATAILLWRPKSSAVLSSVK